MTKAKPLSVLKTVININCIEISSKKLVKQARIKQVDIGV